MHAYSHAFRKRRMTPQAKVRSWSLTHTRGIAASLGLYLELMPSLEVRRDNFAQWVTRVLNQALLTRGLQVKGVAKLAGIGSQTIYRWKNSAWEKDGPKPDQLVAFCDALDIGTAEPFAILWPGKTERAAPADPILMDPDVQIVLRKLADPNVPDEEKYFLRESMSLLAARANRPGRTIQRRKVS